MDRPTSAMRLQHVAQVRRSRITSVALVGAIVLASITMWIGVPLLWLWLGSLVEGATGSVGAGYGVALGCAALTVIVVARIMLQLSNALRASRSARGLEDNGHALLEHILVISAGVAIAAFMVWFFVFAGADPVPLGVNL